MPSLRTHRFGPFTLLAAERRLTGANGHDLALGPRAFDLLVALVERAGQLVTKDELLAIVWPRLVVEEANLHVQVSQLRKVIGADAIATIPGQGYRFVTPVARGEAAGKRRLSVIVLPFVETGAAPQDEYFADAVTDDITTQLSHIRGSFVIGSPTALAYKREPIDVAALARELGVRYVLQGRLERDARCVELNARLSDASTGAVVWSDVIAVDRSGLRALRNEITARLVNALGLQLITAEAERLAREPPEQSEVDDLLMQARAGGGLSWTRADYARALALAEQALRIDPHHAQALSYHAAALMAQASTWPGPQVAELVAQAEAELQRSIARDAFSAFARETLSRVRQHQFRLDAARAEAGIALGLDANSARAHGWSGALHVLEGDPEAARNPLLRALALSPRDPHRWSWLLWLGMSHLFAGEYAAAVHWYQRSAEVLPFWGTLSQLCAAHAQLGQFDLAHAARQRVEPGAFGHSIWTRLSNHPRFLAQFREHCYGGLIKAGVQPDYAVYELWASRQQPDPI